MFVQWIIFIVFLSYAIYETVWGVVKFKQVNEEIINGTRTKIKFYVQTIITSWILALLILVVHFFTEPSFSKIGFNSISLNSNKWFTYPVITISGLYILYLLYQTINFRIYIIHNKKVKIKLDKNISSILPVTNKEKLVFVFVCLTAGICEEIIFRGYLLYILETFFPTLQQWSFLLISSLIFGIVHIYQGKKYILSIGLLGLFLGCIYLAFGSILPVMIFHFIQDISAIDIMTVRYNDEE